MICELDQTEFYKCERLINDQGHLEVKAVIEEVRFLKHVSRFLDEVDCKRF